MAHYNKERRNAGHDVNFGDGDISMHLFHQPELQVMIEEWLETEL